jgi:hypothetical protein
MPAKAEKRRLSLPLTPEDEIELAALKTEPRREALASLLGVRTEFTSDAALVHAIFDLGLQRVREAQLDAGYAELAKSYADAEARQIARRRRPLTADDE